MQTRNLVSVLRSEKKRGEEITIELLCTSSWFSHPALFIRAAKHSTFADPACMQSIASDHSH